MDLANKKKLIRAIETAPSDEALGEYLASVAKSLNPPRYDNKVMTAEEAALKSLERREDDFKISLEDPHFANISDFFWLTPGLHVIAAPSGHGKTFWALEWAKQAAKSGHKVLILSLEMSPEDLGARLVADIADFPLGTIVKKSFSDVQQICLGEKIQDPSQAWLKQIHIDTAGDYDWVKIEPRLLDRLIQIKPKLVVIDYVQMLHDSNEDGPRSRVLAEISRDLKLFAEHASAAVLLLSQLNREALKDIKKGMNDNLPFVHLSQEHVKDSGGIVEAADSLQMVCVPDRFLFHPENLKNKFQLSVEKSRRIGILRSELLPFDSSTMKFR